MKEGRKEGRNECISSPSPLFAPFLFARPHSLPLCLSVDCGAKNGAHSSLLFPFLEPMVVAAAVVGGGCAAGEGGEGGRKPI